MLISTGLLEDVSDPESVIFVVETRRAVGVGFGAAAGAGVGAGVVGGYGGAVDWNLGLGMKVEVGAEPALARSVARRRRVQV